jgi:hypothetical protein
VQGNQRGNIRYVGRFWSLYQFLLRVTLTEMHMNFTQPYAVPTVNTKVNRDSLCEGPVSRLTTEKVSIREILSVDCLRRLSKP